MKILGILSDNKRLIRKLELLFGGEYEVHIFPSEVGKYDILITDADRFDLSSENQIKLSRNKDRSDCITLPFCYSELREAVKATDTSPAPRLALSEREYAAYLGKRKIKLTDVEYRLLHALISADGYVTKDALLKAVWGGKRDGGVVNVYIHYLREKLEREGEKIILSSRREGYGIDERYRRGKQC